MPSSKSKILMSVAVFCVVFGFSLTFGPQGIAYINDGMPEDLLETILWDIRLPRLLVACLSGGALAVAGVISQGVFRNPLAGPSIIGTVSGANLLVVLLMFTGFAEGNWLAQPLAAFLGSLLSTLVILKMSQKESFKSSGSLLLLGFSINAICAAATTFLLSLSMNEYNLSQSIMYWLLGGFNGKGWHHLWMGAPLLITGLVVAFRVAMKLNVLNLGEEIAQTLSIPVSSVKTLSIVAIAILVAASVASSGGISFVGLIVPHMTRIYMGAEHKNLMRVSFFNGMTLVVLADTFALSLIHI